MRAVRHPSRQTRLQERYEAGRRWRHERATSCAAKSLPTLSALTRIACSCLGAAAHCLFITRIGPYCLAAPGRIDWAGLAG